MVGGRGAAVVSSLGLGEAGPGSRVAPRPRKTFDAVPTHPVWERMDMRSALARRDIAAVYKLLQRHGMSQRAIGGRVQQGQSEVSEILSGREVTSYRLLVRVAVGFGIPRGWLGLDYDEETVAILGGGWEAAIRDTGGDVQDWWAVCQSLGGR